MTNIKTIYECSKCGAQYPKWQGRCNECGVWSTIQSKVQSLKSKVDDEVTPAEVVDFSRVEAKDVKRILVGIGEFDRVLGGGIVPGSLVLLGGEPGIGKSTLILQVASQLLALSGTEETIVSSLALGKTGQQSLLYISGEESAEQVKIRFDRLGLKSTNLKFLNETEIETVIATIKKEKPQVVIVDSIQTVHSLEIGSEPGSITQVRVGAAKLMEVAKEQRVSIFIIGHVTKEGTVAGPKTLEHLVDTVLYLEGDRYHDLRILRAVKNRFGSTNEVGVFEMTSFGLAEVKNPSQVFIDKNKPGRPGVVVTCVIEGTRPFLIEIQALVSRTAFGYPQRKTSGFNLNRLQLLLAVLEKRLGFRFSDQDVFLNVSGGLKIKEPAGDLAVCIALVSARKNVVVKSGTVIFGEVSLSGEVRKVSQQERRVKEAKSLGYENVVCETGDVGEAVKMLGL